MGGREKRGADPPRGCDGRGGFDLALSSPTSCSCHQRPTTSQDSRGGSCCGPFTRLLTAKGEAAACGLGLICRFGASKRPKPYLLSASGLCWWNAVGILRGRWMAWGSDSARGGLRG